MKRKTYLTLPGTYQTFKGDFLAKLEESGKEALLLEDCVRLKIGKIYFWVSLIMEKELPGKTVSKAFGKSCFAEKLGELHDGCTPADLEGFRFFVHIAEWIEEDQVEILSTSFSQYNLRKQYPMQGTPYCVTGFRVTRD